MKLKGANKRQPRPIHPGEILREDFLPEYGLTAGSLAKALLVPRDRIERIIRGSRALTADTAARLARFFGTTPQFWLNLQANYGFGFVNEQELLAKASPANLQTTLRAPHKISQRHSNAVAQFFLWQRLAVINHDAAFALEF